MSKKVIATDQAPSAIGPYSQAIATDNLLFISGQLPINPADGRLIDGNIAEKTRQIMENIKAIAREAGANLENIVKTTIFLTDLADFQAVNEAYGKFFPDAPPARSTVLVAALPLGSNIEIESILALD
jgi:2-iminobutanoate/2-iminopropanoate deaminase